MFTKSNFSFYRIDFQNEIKNNPLKCLSYRIPLTYWILLLTIGTVRVFYAKRGKKKKKIMHIIIIIIIEFKSKVEVTLNKLCDVSIGWCVCVYLL